jgi:hypothetical protein
MARRVIVLTTATAPDDEVEAVRGRVGEDAEIHVVAPASKISRLDRLANDEDAAREDAAGRAEAAADAVPGENVEAHVGDVDPIRAIEDALRLFPADEVFVFTAPEDRATWIEGDLGRRVTQRISLPVTYLSTS